MFNSLKYAKQLEQAGVSREQAEAHLQIIGEVLEMNLASRQDITDVRAEIADVRTELKHEIAELRTEVRTEFALVRRDMIQLEQRMTIKLGTIVSIAIGVAVTLAKLVT